MFHSMGIVNEVIVYMPYKNYYAPIKIINMKPHGGKAYNVSRNETNFKNSRV